MLAQGWGKTNGILLRGLIGPLILIPLDVAHSEVSIVKIVVRANSMRRFAAGHFLKHSLLMPKLFPAVSVTRGVATQPLPATPVSSIILQRIVVPRNSMDATRRCELFSL